MDGPPPIGPAGDLAALQAELDRVRRREAQFRADMVQEFLDRGERNSYVHVLHEQRAALLKREQEASLDLEQLTRAIEAESERTAALSAELARLKRSLSWRLAAPLRALGGLLARPAPPPPPPARAEVEAAPFTYYLHTSPFRIYRSPTFTLRGWAWPLDGRAVTGIRVNVGGRVFEGRHGLEEPEVIARYGPQAANPRPGFEVVFETPPGRHVFSLEAQIEGAAWRWILRTSIWSEAKAP